MHALSPDSPIRSDYPDPLWVQAATLIAGDVAGGRLAPGSRLPPERELCEQLGISRVTLRKALGKLVTDGVLSSSHGRGWYVTDGTEAGRKEWPNTLESFSETAQRMGLTSTSRVLEAAVGHASLDEAESLGVAPGTAVFRLRRIRMLDGVPIALDASVTPAALLADAEQIDFSTASLFERLSAAGANPERGESTIEARSADAAVADALGMDAGEPLLVMHQVAYDRGDRAVCLSTISYVGDRYRLRTLFMRPPR